MSYAQRQATGISRTVAISVVAMVHGLLGYALVNGLAYTVVRKAGDELKIFDVTEPPPPPPIQPPPPERKKEPESRAPETVAPSVVQPKAAVPTAREAPMAATAPAEVWPAPQMIPPPPPPQPVQMMPARSATGDLQSLFRPEDYPQSALEHFVQGSVTVELTVGPRGFVRGCDVTASSGSRTLDEASCRILRSRARFTPAQDSFGNLTYDTVSQRIRWILREDLR